MPVPDTYFMSLDCRCIISSNEQNVCENALCTLEDITIQMRATTKRSFYVMLPVIFRKQVALSLKHCKDTENSFQPIIKLEFTKYSTYQLF